MIERHHAPPPVMAAMRGLDARLANQLVIADTWTAELATSNPALFFLLVRTGRAPGMTCGKLTNLVRLPRARLLEAIGCHPSASTERFLRRVAFHDLVIEAEQALRALVDQPLPPWALHCRRPHLALLSGVKPSRWSAAARVFDAVLQQDPHARNRRGHIPSAAELSGYWGKPYVRQVIEEIVEVLRLVDFGAHWMRHDPNHATVCAALAGQLERCRTLADIQRVHQRVIEVNGHLWTEPADSDLENQPWPDPPIPGNDDIEPVTSLAELRREGKDMHHCVATYAERIIQGQGYVYRVHRPERATLYVGRDANGGWCVRELRLSCNGNPDKRTRANASGWLTTASAIGTLSANDCISC